MRHASSRTTHAPSKRANDYIYTQRTRAHAHTNCFSCECIMALVWHHLKLVLFYNYPQLRTSQAAMLRSMISFSFFKLISIAQIYLLLWFRHRFALVCMCASLLLHELESLPPTKRFHLDLLNCPVLCTIYWVYGSVLGTISQFTRNLLHKWPAARVFCQLNRNNQLKWVQLVVSRLSWQLHTSERMGKGMRIKRFTNSTEFIEYEYVIECNKPVRHDIDTNEHRLYQYIGARSSYLSINCSAAD